MLILGTLLLASIGAGAGCEPSRLDLALQVRKDALLVVYPEWNAPFGTCGRSAREVAWQIDVCRETVRGLVCRTVPDSVGERLVRGDGSLRVLGSVGLTIVTGRWYGASGRYLVAQLMLRNGQ